MKYEVPVAVGVIAALVLLFLHKSREKVAPSVMDVSGLTVINAYRGPGGDHFSDEPGLLSKQRYPVAAGMNITSLVMNGTTAPFGKLPHDYDYITSPPSSWTL